jgi:hypothetical protein
VCAGVARYFRIDPIVVRIGAVALALAGPGIVVYGLGWLLLPTPSSPPLVPPASASRKLDGPTQVVGIVLLVVAISVLWGHWWLPGDGFFLPLGLIALGAWLLLRHEDPTRGDPPPPGSGGPAWDPGSSTVVTPPPAKDSPAEEAAGDTETTAAPTTEEPTDGDDQTTVVDPDSTWAWQPGDGGPGDGGPGGRAPWEHPAADEPAPDPEADRRRRLLGPIVFGLLLMWGGIAWLAGIQVEDALAVGLCLIGAGFVLGAFVGGSRALLLPALVVGLALATTAVIDVPLSGGIGDRSWTPASAAEVRDTYRLGIGEGVLDLRYVVPGRGETVAVDASVGIGHLEVLVPDDVDIDITSRATAGESVLFGNAIDGVDIDHDRTVEGDAGRGTIELDLSVGLGQIEVVERPSLGRPDPTTTTAPSGPTSTSTTVLR